MAGWKQNEWGLLVPEKSWESSPRMVSINDYRGLFKKLKTEKRFLLAKRRRQVQRGTERAPETLDSWAPLDVEKLKAHVLGRGEESAKVLVGVAFLRSLDWVPRDPEVSFRGAQYQLGKGSELYAAAHRFPCDPNINNWSIPHHSRSKALAGALEEPLKKTDYLPKLVNYADLLFEYGGGTKAVLEPVRFVLHDQKPGAPLHVNLIRHALLNMLLPAFRDAYYDILGVAEANEVGIDLFSPAAIEEINQASLEALSDLDVTSPSQHMQIVRYALRFSAQLAATEGEPVGASRYAILRYARFLELKSKQA